MKKIMILGASILQLPAIEEARNMGLTVVAVDQNPCAVGFSPDGVIKEVISTIDTPAILEAARRHSIDGIMTLASDMPMRSVAVVSHALGLEGVSEGTAFRCTNKAAMRDALKAYGVPIPLYFRVGTKDEFVTAVRAIFDAGFSCIVKPVDNSGSRGVRLLTDTHGLSDAYEYSLKNSRNGELIVEEFMEGAEVSVETIAVEGNIHVVQITDKLTTGAPYFVEMGHSQPSQLDEDVLQQIRETAVAANRAVGIASGPSHTEIKVTKDGPKIVELGARLGGDCITTHLVPLSTGVDMIACAIHTALGDTPDVTPKWSRGSAIRYIPTASGMLTSVRGLEEAEHIPGVVQISLVHQVGERFGEIQNSANRMGFVIAQAENAQNAIRIAEQALEHITLEYDNA